MLGIARDPEAIAKWTGDRPVSEKQAQLLLRAGVDPSSMSGNDARRLCSEIVARFKTGKCTFKQAAILRKHGLDPNITKAEATKAIDGIFKKTYTAPAEPRQYPVSTEVF